MIIGIPKEIKQDENRVSLLPAGALALTAKGHRALVEKGAGEASGVSDEEYTAVGATIVESAEEVFREADMVVKVKEPLPGEWGMIREGQVVFTYFHFASSEELTRAMVDSGAVAIAYETIRGPDGGLPLLKPMSEVAGRMAVQQGAKYLEREHGGRGVLLSGVPGVEPATVMILGAGIVGLNAAKVASALGAQVRVFDVNLDRLRYFNDIMPPNVVTQVSNDYNISAMLERADVVISGVLIPGGKAPRLVRKEHLPRMKRGAVIVDVAIDQGGSAETSKPTTHQNPIYEVDGVIHYCVTNMPGAMPVTSTIALTNATLPYVMRLANQGWREAAKSDAGVRSGINIAEGKVIHPAVAEAFGLEAVELDAVL